jgi:hypothetical protein
MKTPASTSTKTQAPKSIKTPAPISNKILTPTSIKTPDLTTSPTSAAT